MPRRTSLKPLPNSNTTVVGTRVSRNSYKAQLYVLGRERSVYSDRSRAGTRRKPAIEKNRNMPSLRRAANAPSRMTSGRRRRWPRATMWRSIARIDRLGRGHYFREERLSEPISVSQQRSTLALPSRARMRRTDFPGALRLTDLLEPPGRRDLVIFVLAKLLVGRFRFGADDGAQASLTPTRLLNPTGAPFPSSRVARRMVSFSRGAGATHREIDWEEARCCQPGERSAPSLARAFRSTPSVNRIGSWRGLRKPTGSIA